jgi:hypothetical protein
MFNGKACHVLKNHLIEEITNTCKAYAKANEIRFELLPNSEIAEIYKNVSTDGWSKGSCMAEENCDFFEIYTDNPETWPSILVGFIGEEIVFRSLRVVTAEGLTMQDRHYFKKEEIEEAFFMYCKENGLTCKNKSALNYNTVRLNGDADNLEELESSVCIKFPADEYKSLPYMDTFKFSTTSKNELSTEEPTRAGVYIKLDSTCGGYSEIQIGVWDVIDEVYIDEENAVEIGFGMHRGSRTHESNVYYSERNEGYILL